MIYFIQLLIKKKLGLINLIFKILESPNYFDNYAYKVRKEYSEYSDEEYYNGRIEVLNNLLKIDYIKEKKYIERELEICKEKLGK